MTKNAADYTHWFIFDGVGAVDGEIFNSYESLIRAAGWHDAADLVVCAFDIGSPRMIGDWTRKGETQLVDVTKQVAADWWESLWNDTFEKVRAGSGDFCFLARFYTREIDAFEAEINAPANFADAWRDMQAAV